MTEIVDKEQKVFSTASCTCFMFFVAVDDNIQLPLQHFDLLRLVGA